ncbi:MAG: transcriptional repressor [Chloroflexaceae bacterium]|nr:transcriptional repressor [Chloroflexaceae bacterium]
MAHPESDQTPAHWRRRTEAALRDAGLRCTFPRHAILDWIAAAAAPFTAEQVVAALETQHGTSSRATIYRLLDWLQAAGWLTRLYSDGTQHTYARFWPGHHHIAVCLRCGSATIMSECHIEEGIRPALAALDFELQGHVLELYGVCGNCRTHSN